MYGAEKCFPWRIFIAIFSLAVGLVLIFYFWKGSGQQADTIPVMSKPSVFYQLGKMLSPYDEYDRQLNRELWQGSYEMDAMMADPELSLWGGYQVAGPGINPNSVGKLSDQELSLLREELRDRAQDDWQNAPADIRRKYQQLYDALPK